MTTGGDSGRSDEAAIADVLEGCDRMDRMYPVKVGSLFTARVRALVAEVARLNDIYLSAVRGRADFRSAVREARSDAQSEYERGVADERRRVADLMQERALSLEGRAVRCDETPWEHGGPMPSDHLRAAARELRLAELGLRDARKEGGG